VHRSIAASLRPGGYLMVGATERVAEPRALGLDPVHPFIYRKAA
jgi:chemotaxis protein methyltransferase CheR